MKGGGAGHAGRRLCGFSLSISSNWLVVYKMCDLETVNAGRYAAQNEANK